MAIMLGSTATQIVGSPPMEVGLSCSRVAGFGGFQVTGTADRYETGLTMPEFMAKLDPASENATIQRLSEAWRQLSAEDRDGRSQRFL